MFADFNSRLTHVINVYIRRRRLQCIIRSSIGVDRKMTLWVHGNKDIRHVMHKIKLLISFCLLLGLVPPKVIIRTGLKMIFVS